MADTAATIGGRSLDTILARCVVMVFALVSTPATLLAFVLVGSGFSHAVSGE